MKDRVLTFKPLYLLREVYMQYVVIQPGAAAALYVIDKTKSAKTGQQALLLPEYLADC